MKGEGPLGAVRRVEEGDEGVERDHRHFKDDLDNIILVQSSSKGYYYWAMLNSEMSLMRRKRRGNWEDVMKDEEGNSVHEDNNSFDESYLKDHE